MLASQISTGWGAYACRDIVILLRLFDMSSLLDISAKVLKHKWLTHKVISSQFSLSTCDSKSKTEGENVWGVRKQAWQQVLNWSTEDICFGAEFVWLCKDSESNWRLWQRIAPAYKFNLHWFAKIIDSSYPILSVLLRWKRKR